MLKSESPHKEISDRPRSIASLNTKVEPDWLANEIASQRLLDKTLIVSEHMY